MSFRQSLLFSLFYFTIACLFGVYVFYAMGGDSTKEYFTCFLIEKAMSLDNVFIISMIFQFFSIPSNYQHRVLFLGIIGVIVFRAILIYGGIIIIAKFSWILYIFAVILIITGVKTFYISHKTFDIQNSYIYGVLTKYLNITPKLAGDKFFVRLNRPISKLAYGREFEGDTERRTAAYSSVREDSSTGSTYKLSPEVEFRNRSKLYVTPLFVSLILIEIIDLVFAIDSIPAIFAITNNPYIIYTSNIFAILGLRALFFCLANIVERFRYIKYSLALILIFIGIKIFIHPFIEIQPFISLIVTITLLILGVIVSIAKKIKKSA